MMENAKVIKIIEDFLKRKKETPLEKIYKDAIESVKNEVEKSSGNEDLKIEVQKIINAKKAKEQGTLDSVREKFDNLFNLNYQSVFFLNEIKSDVSEKIIELDKKFDPTQWINDVAKKASRVNLEITHVAKLTHSSAGGSNINAKAYKSESSKPLLVTTNSSNSPEEMPFDYAYSSPEYAPIAQFLTQDCEGEILGKIICDQPSVLSYFAENDEQIKQWQEQIRLAFNEKRKSSHELLKQVYFPMESSYHLLTPLVSSCMVQIVYERIWDTRKKEVPAREAKKDGLFSEKLDVSYPNTAILKLTQTNHQNVSNLNGKRSGQMILLPSQPPQWKKQLKPPISIKTIFNRELGYQAKDPAKKLQNLLLAIKFNELSTNLQRKRLISALITEIADIVFDHVAQIQRLKQYVGWLQESKLPMHQQYWLDPFRENEEFQTARNTLDWQTNVTIDFAEWVNKQIRHPKLTLGSPQEDQWGKLFSPLLREFNAIYDAIAADTVFKEGKNE